MIESIAHCHNQSKRAVMLICEGDDFLEMTVTDRIPDHLPASGDTRFEIKVQSFGFSGQSSVWIDRLALISFAAQLQELENRRQGEAELSSISPSQFWLRIYSTDSLGQMALAGRLSRLKPDLNCEHLVEFGFRFDPSVLPSIVKGFEKIQAEFAIDNK
ncbi:hypothetical protein IQ250_05440 [Pseudanabaenaceae cyanobacterium LEGE 13415]|nr:hypothetical protein [Pseudanabaenaceae cyanobacterium LEGE 13415]